MAAAPTALARTSTDTLVTALGRLHDGLEQLIASAASTRILPVADVNLGLDYALAHAEVVELLDARLARG